MIPDELTFEFTKLWTKNLKNNAAPTHQKEATELHVLILMLLTKICRFDYKSQSA
jgi:hypothetical protein